MEKPLKIRLHVLSPIHIGCDNVYEPTSFVIDENKKKLIAFDPLDFIKTLTADQKNEFMKICSGDNLLSLYKFTKRNFRPTIPNREVDIASGLAAHYKKVIKMSSYDKNTVINQFTINRTSYNTQNNFVYIPGSSLKGSIRTAYLNAIAKVAKIENWQGKAIELERKLLQGSFDADPFRMVKVSDLIPVSVVKTKILYAVNRKKKESEYSSLAEKGPQQIFEVITDGIFKGTINIDNPLRGSNIVLPITPDNLGKSINKFYIPLMEAEIKMLKELDINIPLINKINSNFSGKINKSAFIIRIGRHSGAEAVTIEGNRNIKIMQGKNKKPKYLPYSTTIWLASEESNPKNNNMLVPFGWAVMEVLERT
jgi:CRISPR-associated protein Csm5